jgi:hypothetical protein
MSKNRMAGNFGLVDASATSGYLVQVRCVERFNTFETGLVRLKTTAHYRAGFRCHTGVNATRS